MADADFTTEELAAEEWRPVPDTGGNYMVSSLGRVARIMRGAPNSHNGYRYVSFLWKDAVRQIARTIHSVVAAAFIGPRPPGYYVNHIDNVRHNNRAANLEYVTPTENQRHSWRTTNRNRQRGERHGHAKLTETAVREIRRLHATGMRFVDIAPLFGVSSQNISVIVKRKLWSHVA